MQSIEYNKGNLPILNQMYVILVNSNHKIKIEIKENEEAYKAGKHAIDMPGITTTKLPYTE